MPPDQLEASNLEKKKWLEKWKNDSNTSSNDKSNLKASTNPTATPLPNPQPKSSSLRLEVYKNDGQKSNSKAIVLKINDLNELKQMACHKLKLNYLPGVTKVFSITGKEIRSTDELEQDQKIFISHQGQPFIQMALKQKKKQQQQQQQQDDMTSDQQQQHSSNVTKSNAEAAISRKMAKLPTGISEIVEDFLYLGSARDATNELSGFSHILNAAKEWPEPKFPTTGNRPKYLKLDLSDSPHENLLLHLEKALSFLEDAGKQNGRVLVHCVLGKSRSPSIIIAYLVKFKSMSLLEAFEVVKEKRKSVLPNRSFIRQLMLFEQNEHRKPTTLHWDNVFNETELLLLEMQRSATPKLNATPSAVQYYMDKHPVEEWLVKNHVEGSAPTHLWWEVINKKQYSIPFYLLDELYSECAKSIFFGQTLKLVEMRSEAQKYKLHLDVDIKLDDISGISTDVDWEIRMYKMWIPLIGEVVNTVFPTRSSEQLEFIVTGVAGPHKSSQIPQITTKYGYHFIWPKLLVDLHEHKKFIYTLIEKAKSRTWDAFVNDKILKFNDWNDIFDTTLFQSIENGLRYLIFLLLFLFKPQSKKKLQAYIHHQILFL